MSCYQSPNFQLRTNIYIYYIIYYIVYIVADFCVNVIPIKKTYLNQNSMSCLRIFQMYTEKIIVHKYGFTKLWNRCTIGSI